MNILLVLILTVCASASSAFIRTQRRQPGPEGPGGKSKKLSDDQILEAISALLSDKLRDEEPSLADLTRHSKQIDDGLTEAEAEAEAEESARQTLLGQESCEVTGYEMRVREECEEVSETQCKPITLTKYRTEIVNKCETKIDDQTCKVTYSGIPRQECVPKKSKRCSIEYDIVPETLYKEECHVTVQHVCEEFVPVPVPVHVGYPVGAPPPTPPPQPLFSVTPPYKTVRKRESEAGLDQRQIKEIVREMLSRSSQVDQSGERGARHLITFPDTSSTVQAETNIFSSVGGQTGRQTSLPNLTPVQTTDRLDPSVLGSPLVSVPSRPHPPLVVSPPPPPPPVQQGPEPEHPPLVTTYELAQQYPGCRSIATKTCHKLPSTVEKKVPREKCRDVPDVECFNVLKEVPELECIPEPYEECNDVAKDIPYLEPAEECEEIFYDDCVEVTESIPVELCKRKRVDEESIFLSRGKVFRKEGEKRRKKVGNRAAAEERKKNKEEDGE